MSLSISPQKPSSPSEHLSLSLHDALPISVRLHEVLGEPLVQQDVEHAVLSSGIRYSAQPHVRPESESRNSGRRSEEHTSELQSRLQLVCRLLLEKNNQKSSRDSSGDAAAA